MENVEKNSIPEQPSGFELSINALADGNGVRTKLSHQGKPSSSREIGAVPVNVAARALTFMYEAALVGTGREDTPTERAMFFTAMQPEIMHVFFGMTDSWQFRKGLAELRESARMKEDAKEKTKPAA